MPVRWGVARGGKCLFDGLSQLELSELKVDLEECSEEERDAQLLGRGRVQILVGKADFERAVDDVGHHLER